ncbi:hypothetical protein BGZ49_007320 [Haplosporangium sp. Z 27]|nr:hypothetical protein BGZ49_007320 [Haplosporangium sp. Z 27]
MYTRSLAVTFFGLGLLANSIQADTIDFVSPKPNSILTTNQVVKVTYEVHLNGMAELLWANVHLITEDGKDAGVGNISTAKRQEWQDTLTVSSDFKVPGKLKPGKYSLHVYGNTLQPCEGSVDMTKRCEGILSETLPVEIGKTPDGGKKDHGRRKRKRELYIERTHTSEHALQDEGMDTKKMLYFFSLI